MDTAIIVLVLIVIAAIAGGLVYLQYKTNFYWKLVHQIIIN